LEPPTGTAPEADDSLPSVTAAARTRHGDAVGGDSNDGSSDHANGDDPADDRDVTHAKSNLVADVECVVSPPVELFDGVKELRADSIGLSGEVVAGLILHARRSLSSL
jgi:hypothetical protein